MSIGLRFRVRLLASVALISGATLAGLFVPMAAAGSSATMSTVPVAYHLPYPAGLSYQVAQGNGGPYTHRSRFPSEFAWDFALPLGSMVSAAADGTVVGVEDGFSGGGGSQTYEGMANYVVLAHADGRYSLYLHLAHGGVLVHIGERVKAGQGIALSGNTGHSSGPHLHFQVQETAASSGSQSVPSAFVEAGVPKTGDRPVSANVLASSPTTPRALPNGLAGPDRALFTGQAFTIDLNLSFGLTADGPSDGSADDETPAVRLVSADGAGQRTVLVATLQGTKVSAAAVAPLVGPFTYWAEYRDGLTWRTLADTDGRLAARVLTVEACDLFLASPGVVVNKTAAETDDAVDVSFTVTNLGTVTRNLYKTSLEVVTSTGTTVPASVAEGSRIPEIARVTLAPGQRFTWRGSVRFSASGSYALRARALDPAADVIPLPPAEWGGPTSAQLVVRGEEPPRPSPTFADVPAGHPAYLAAEALAARGLLTGYPDGRGGRRLRPEEPVARAQFAKLLLGVLGIAVTEADKSAFVDVEDSGPGSLYPDNVVAAASGAGLVLGLGTDPPTFAPYAPVTRGQAAAMATRADPARAWSIPGDPWGAATRAEAVILLAGLLR